MGRTPHGVRGLKFISIVVDLVVYLSHSAWSAWIEIAKNTPISAYFMSHSAWSAWIEITTAADNVYTRKSHSAWSAWIEIGGVLARSAIKASRTPHGVRGLK